MANKTVQGIPSQTDKQIVPLNLRLTDLSGGQNSYTNPSLLELKEAHISCGVSYRQKGTVRVQRGRVKRYMTTIANYTTGGMGAYYKRDSKSYFVMVIGNTIYYDKALLNFLYTSAANFQTGTRNIVNSVTPISWSGDYMYLNNYWRACLLAFASGEPYPYVPISNGSGITVGYSFTPKTNLVVSSITMKAWHGGINTTSHLFKISVWEYSTKERLVSQTGTAYSYNSPQGEVDFIAELATPLALKANTEYILSCYTVSGEIYEWTVDLANTHHSDDFTWTASHNKSSAGDNFPETTSRSNKYLCGLYLQEYDITDLSTGYNTDAELNTGTYTNSALSSGKAVVSSLVGASIAPVYEGEELTHTVRYDTNKVKLQTDVSYWNMYQDLTWEELSALEL